MIYLFIEDDWFLCLMHALSCVPQHRPQHVFVHCMAARFFKHEMQ